MRDLINLIPESESNSIVVSISGHCLNTQCLTVYTLDNMASEIQAKIISSVHAKNATRYKVRFTDGKVGYIFIRGKDFLLMSTNKDTYIPLMDSIIPTLELLSAE